MRPIALSLCLCLALGAFAVRAAPEPPAPSVPEPEPSALQQGALSNGFRYAVLPHATAPGRISLRLIVHAGSLDEQDDELGFAHFVEHMAFNGTTHYPPGKLVEFFQRNGLAWGVDANAETSFTHTTYKIDLPAGHGDQLPEALQILRDFADGIAFAVAEVKREKGVILSEITARETNEWQVGIAKLSAVYAGSLIPARIPLSTTTAVKQATAARLRAFYQRAYRPERMTLLVVGDVTSGSFTPLLEEVFQSLAPVGPGCPQVLPQLPAGEGLRAHVIGNPNATAALVTLSSVMPVSPDAAIARATGYADYVVLRALDRRLEERQRQMAEQIGAVTEFRISEIDRRFRRIGLEVQSRADAWPAAVALIENELRRAREDGFSTEEILEITRALLASARADRDAAPRATPVQLANELAELLALGVDWQPPAAALAEIESWVLHFAPEAARVAMRSMFPDDRLHLMVTSRDAGKVWPAALLAAFGESAASPLAVVAAPAGEELRFRYKDFGPSGRVLAHRTVPDLGVELVEFANGARMNFRTSTTEPNHFKLVAHLGRGFADAPRDRPGMSWLAVCVLGTCDLSRHTRGELGRLIQLRAVDAGVNFAADRFTVTLEGPSTELSFALQFLAAFLSDLKFEETKQADALSAYAGMRGSQIGTSQSLSVMDMNFRLRSDDPRYTLPPPSEVERYPFAEVVAWTRATWLDGPIEIALCGDFEPQVAIAATAATVGALPTRHEAASLLERERCVFPDKPHRNLFGAVLTDRAATVQFVWVANDLANARTRRALFLANSGLADRLSRKLREELGATYSPIQRIFHESMQPDFGFANIEITFDPKRAQKLSKRVLTMADEMARKGLSAEEFSRARAPLIAGVTEDLLRNAWWLETVLSRAQSQPSVLDEARTMKADFESITLEEVNRVAAAHYRFSNAHGVGIIPEAPPAQVSSPAQ